MSRTKPPAPVRSRRTLVGRVVLEEDPDFDWVEITSPILLRGLDPRAGRYWVHATLHDRIVTVVSDNRPPLRVSLEALVEGMLLARPERKSR